MYSPFTFPAPHQLGKRNSSSPLSPRLSSSSLNSDTTSRTLVPISSDTTPVSSSYGRFEIAPLPLLAEGLSVPLVDSALTLEDSCGTDEPDSAPPPPKRAKTRASKNLPLQPKRRKAQGKRKNDRKNDPVVTTFNGKPLKKFSLYLPPRLPASIVTDKLAFASFTTSTASTYLGLWKLDKNMDILDVRLPPEYSKRLQDDQHFLCDFVESVFDNLSDVKSIKDVYLPAVTIRNNLCSSLLGIFFAFSESPCSISHVFLPVNFATEVSNVGNFDLTNIAQVLRAAKINEVTLVSSCDLLPQFYSLLHSALAKNGKSSIKLSTLNHEASPPGPAYLTDAGKPTPIGVKIEPHTLLEGLNTGGSCDCGKNSSKPSKGGSSSHLKNKASLKRAFTTDCSYTEDQQLSTDSTFASQLWDLERLHENGIDGSGTTIAVLDSGISYASPAFKDKIIAVRNFVPNEIDDVDCAIDSDGHGSLCAGIAASQSFYCPLNPTDPASRCLKIPPGVAPGAKLIICKVVETSSGVVNNEAFLAALKWLKEIHELGATIDVVSISLASSYFSHERDKVISDLITLGVIVVCCASNVGRMKLQPISYPGRLGHVLCIGTHDANGKPASFSPVGRELDFLAPGDDIWGPGPGTMGPFALDCASGTSCSTPAVAGLVCLVLHAIRRRCVEDIEVDTTIAGKSLTHYVKNVWVMREILKEMSSSPGHHSEEIGYGTLNPYRVLDRSTEEIVRIVNEIIEAE